MDFAKNFMKKYGWNEGEGLGKNKRGINKPLKANLKFDTSGLGVDKAADFNNFWWQRVYNEASNNINVKKDSGEISIHAKKDDSVEITTKNYSIKNLKNKNESQYANFFKSSTLTSSGIEIDDPNKVNSQDIEMPKFSNLTDEELFNACGGRTAHKGARHGLKLTGKLQRIQEQEQALLEKYSKMSDIDIPKSTIVSNEWIEVTNKKKKSKKDKDSCNKMNEENCEKMNEDDNLNSIEKHLHLTEYIHKSKKKRKKAKKVDEEISNSFEYVKIAQNPKNSDQTKNEIVKLSDSSKSIRKKKKSKKNIKVIFGQENMDQSDEMEDDVKIKQDLEKNIIKENNCTKFNNDLVKLDSKRSVKEKKLKKNKIGKIKCEDKIIAKKIKKTINVLENLNTFLNVN